MFSEFCSISALSCSFEFVWWWCGCGCGWVGGWWYSQRLLSLNPTTVMVVLLLGLWLLLGCDNYFKAEVPFVCLKCNQQFSFATGPFPSIACTVTINYFFTYYCNRLFLHVRLYTSTAAMTQLVFVSANPATRHLDKYKPERQTRFYRYYEL